MGNRVFHTATIGGKQFEAFMADDGPYISSTKPLSGVSLGVCRIRHFHPTWHVRDQEGWGVVKYDSESKNYLDGFSEQQAHELANEFGINLWEPMQIGNVSEAAFYQGKAWEGLKAWVKAHPRIAKQVIQHTQLYLPGWYERALGLWAIVTTEQSPLRAKVEAKHP